MMAMAVVLVTVLLLPCTIQSSRMKNMKNALSRLFSISMCCTRYTAVACNYISGDVIANFRSATRMYRTYVTRFGWWIMKRMRTREDTRALIPVHNNYTNTWYRRISIYSISDQTHTHRRRRTRHDIDMMYSHFNLHTHATQWMNLAPLSDSDRRKNLRHDDEYSKMGIRRQSHPSTREQWCAIN